MPTNAEIEKDQYEKINALTGRVEQLVGAVDVANQINLELMKLIKKALCYMFWIIVFLICAIIYGAIGKDGFYAVRPDFKGCVAIQTIAPPPDTQITVGGVSV